MLDTNPLKPTPVSGRRSVEGDAGRRAPERAEIARKDEAHRWIEARRRSRKASAPRRLPAVVSA